MLLYKESQVQIIKISKKTSTKVPTRAKELLFDIIREDRIISITLQKIF